jgi:hypothetical protein
VTDDGSVSSPATVEATTAPCAGQPATAAPPADATPPDIDRQGERKGRPRHYRGLPGQRTALHGDAHARPLKKLPHLPALCGKGALRTDGGHSSNVTVRLPRACFVGLQRVRSLRVELKADVHDAAANLAAQSTNVRLLAPARRRSHQAQSMRCSAARTGTTHSRYQPVRFRSVRRERTQRSARDAPPAELENFRSIG